LGKRLAKTASVYFSKKQPPEVDFIKNFVVCAFMGTRPPQAIQ
jgi:hypothetical protein